MRPPSHQSIRPRSGEELQPVQLGASAPRQVKPGAEFTARFVAYEKALEQEVRALLTKLAPSAETVLGIKECRWKRDTRVTVKLSGRGLTIDPPEQEFTWQGGRSLLEFDVAVPDDAEEGTIPLKFDVSIEGIIVARLRLDLEIAAAPKKKGRATATGEPATTGFASYSSKDRLRVLDRVDAIQISAGIDVFQDCLDLHPGEEWKPRLDNEIRQTRSLPPLLVEKRQRVHVGGMGTGYGAQGERGAGPAAPPPRPGRQASAGARRAEHRERHHVGAQGI